MSANTQNNAPVSAESVVTLNGAQLLQALDFIAPDRDTDPHQLECELTISFADGPAGGGYYCYCTDYPDEGAIMLDAETADDLISSDSDTELTQQTLDDVKAGIPARDAEIEALRKEIETLQAAQAQPTGLVKQLCDALELAKTCHGAMLMSDPPQEMWKARGVDRVISEALNAAKAQLPVSGAVQFRDAAQMIEPSGNSGELPRLPLNDPAAAYRVLHDYGQSCAHAALALSHPDTATYQQAKAWKAVCAALDFVNPRWTEEDGTGEECAVKAIVSLAQQDADKVDAERWRAYRAAIATEDSAFLGRGESYLSALGLRAEVLPTEGQIDAAIDAARKEQA